MGLAAPPRQFLSMGRSQQSHRVEGIGPRSTWALEMVFSVFTVSMKFIPKTPALSPCGLHVLTTELCRATSSLQNALSAHPSPVGCHEQAEEC